MKIICDTVGSLVDYGGGFDINLELDRIEQEIRSSPDHHSCIDEEGELKMAKKLKKLTKGTELAGFSAADLAEELDMAPGDLRKALRAVNAKKPGKQWIWSKKSDPDLEKVREKLKARSGGKDSKKSKKKRDRSGE